MLPYLLGALFLTSVGKATAERVEEMRRLFREVKCKYGTTLTQTV